MELIGKNITYKYPSSKKYVLKDVDITLNSDKITGLIGESGKGKSTLCKILSNYKEKQKLLKKKYGRKYKKYELEPIKNEYGKINEYKVIESKHKNLNSVEMVFTKNNGSYVGTDIIKYPFKIIHNELGIKNCRFYDLRGSYATQILRKGAEIRDVADILGHSRIETTENYYIASSEKTRKEANNILEKIIQADVIYEVINY